MRQDVNAARTTTRLRRTLLAWFRENARPLAWRRHPTPYRVWVSEIMLQQTQAATVSGYFERFMARFPDLEALAAAEEAEVLALWEGLGYYRRARMLHAAARQVVARGGGLPERFEELRLLPGLGRYSAAAVASIAFGQAVCAVDGNARRVLLRMLGRESLPEAQLWRQAETLLDARAPGDFNQALMELGATVCLPRAPRCPRCPWRAHCRAAGSGRPEAFPAPRRRASTLHVREAAAAVRCRGRWLLCRRDGPGRYRGLWELPRCEADGPGPLAAWLRRELGLSGTCAPAGFEIRYSVTRHRVTLAVHAFTPTSGRARAGGYAEACWFADEAIADLPMSAPMRRALRRLLAEASSGAACARVRSGA